MPIASWKTPVRNVARARARRSGRARLRQRAHRAIDDDRDRRRRPRHEVPARAEQRGDDRRHDGGVQAVLRRHAGDRREGDALRQDDHGADHAGHQVGAGAVPVHPGPPAQERQQPGRPRTGCGRRQGWPPGASRSRRCRAQHMREDASSGLSLRARIGGCLAGVAAPCCAGAVGWSRTGRVGSGSRATYGVGGAERGVTGDGDGERAGVRLGEGRSGRDVERGREAAHGELSLPQGSSPWAVKIRCIPW